MINCSTLSEAPTSERTAREAPASRDLDEW